MGNKNKENDVRTCSMAKEIKMCQTVIKKPKGMSCLEDLNIDW
jgi:hypothetical protein